jgi:hypothetical protein
MAGGCYGLQSTANAHWLRSTSGGPQFGARYLSGALRVYFKATDLGRYLLHTGPDANLTVALGTLGSTANPDADSTHPGERMQTLRTGARFTIGEWTLVYARDECADHGRPYGGRLGGEYSDQPLQPERPDYSDEATIETDAPTHADSAEEK